MTCKHENLSSTCTMAAMDEHNVSLDGVLEIVCKDCGYKIPVITAGIVNGALRFLTFTIEHLSPAEKVQFLREQFESQRRNAEANLHCPHCDGPANVPPEGSADKLYYICNSCRGISMYENGTLRKATEEEIVEGTIPPAQPHIPPHLH